MKKMMFGLTVGVVALLSLGTILTVSRKSDGIHSTTGSYADSQVDTVKFVRPANIGALAFAAEWQDSVSVTSAVYRRVIDGTAIPAIASDTLSSFYAFTGTPTGANPVRAITQAITLAPLADEYWVIVTYASSANGTTSETVKYEFIKQVN